MKNIKIDAVVFDLDGTLVKSHENIYKATVKTFEKLGQKVEIPTQQFYDLLGHHFKDMFDALNLYVDDIEYFIDVYKNLYFDFIDYSKLYNGVEETLSLLKQKKIKTGLLTTKGQDQAEKIVKHFKIDNYFNEIMGRRNGIAIKPSAEPLLLIFDNLKVEPSKSLMVGDAELDIQCGKNANAKTCAVTFGYRSKENLMKENPDFIVDNYSEFIDIINNNKI